MTRLRILSVEDEALNRALLRASLSRADDPRLALADLVEATSLAEARNAMSAPPYDAVLLDRRLPDGDGFELARELRANPGQGCPLIVALTADAVPATRTAAMEAGCHAILTKPYAPRALTSLLLSHLASVAVADRP